RHAGRRLGRLRALSHRLLSAMSAAIDLARRRGNAVSSAMHIRERPSPNHDARPADGAIDMLILHYTGMSSAQDALDRLCSSDARVSAHYLIDEDGTSWRLVP